MDNDQKEYRCPHCGEVIEEVTVVEILWKRLLISAGLGIGCGLLVFPLLAGDRLVGAIGAFLVGFVIVFLVSKVEKKKT